MNSQAYIKCKISEYDAITKETKDFINNAKTEIEKAREINWYKQYTEEQSNIITNTYNKLEKEIEHTFNNSEFLKEELKSGRH